MPPLIAGVVVAVLYVAAGAAGYVAMTTAIVMAVVSIASAAASYALQSKSKAPGFSSLSAQRMVTSRDSIRARDLVYGRIRKGGVVVWIASAYNKQLLTLVIAMAGHEIEDIEEVYFNDELAFDAYGVAQGRYARAPGKEVITLEKHLGYPDQEASGLLMGLYPDMWTADHRLRGVAYMVVGLMYDVNLFRGVPNVTAIVKGKKVFDPRTGTTKWSENSALQVADYLAETRYGLAAPYGTAIDTDALIAAANICDEPVAIPGGTEKRYTSNGILSSAEEPQGNIEMLLSAMAGRMVYSGGLWVISAGAYVVPTLTLDDNDFRGNLQVQTRQQRRDLCNAVRGVFVCPERYWQLTDFPPITAPAFEAQDNGERIWRDVELPFTTSATMAQRLAKIDLYSSREQIALSVPLSLKALRVRGGDTVAITYPRFGWTAKPFLITSWLFSSDRNDQGAPVLGCELQLRETSSAVFDVTADEQRLIDTAPDTLLPDALTVTAPGTPTVTETMYLTRDGAGMKVLATFAWSASPDAFASRYQLEIRYLGPETEEADFRVLGTTPDTSFDWRDATPGRYEVRVKTINDIGVSSEYATQPVLELYGLLAPPNTITGLSLSVLGGLAILRWDRHPDADVRMGGNITFRHSPDPTAPVWQESVSIGDAVPGGDTVAVLPLKPGAYLAKARDASGVLARTAAYIATDGATILAYANIGSVAEHPTFSGGHSGTVAVDSELKLDALGDLDDWADVDAVVSWDSASGIVTSGTYTFASGFDFTTKRRVRLRTDMTAVVINEMALMDQRGDDLDSWQDFDGTFVAEADAQVWARTTDDNPSGTPTWGSWQRVDSAELYCRAVQMQARLSAADSAYNINVSALTVYADALA